MEGQLLVPNFVLDELQMLADASNDQKRSRGRRGLDILNRMQDAYPNRIAIHPIDYEDIPTVDAKLVRFAQEISGLLLTNDYNLSKVANLQKVECLERERPKPSGAADLFAGRYGGAEDPAAR